MTDLEWLQLLEGFDSHEQHILAWAPAAPDPAAVRCVQSRHRTLAHLRACQETWLEACESIAANPGKTVRILHPWRLFEAREYQNVSWHDHRNAFIAGRLRWKSLLSQEDRTLEAKVNNQLHSIESLAAKLVAHEHHHLFTPR